MLRAIHHAMLFDSVAWRLYNDQLTRFLTPGDTPLTTAGPNTSDLLICPCLFMRVDCMASLISQSVFFSLHFDNEKSFIDATRNMPYKMHIPCPTLPGATPSSAFVRTLRLRKQLLELLVAHIIMCLRLDFQHPPFIFWSQFMLTFQVSGICFPIAPTDRNMLRPRNESTPSKISASGNSTWASSLATR